MGPLDSLERVATTSRQYGLARLSFQDGERFFAGISIMSDACAMWSERQWPAACCGGGPGCLFGYRNYLTSDKVDLNSEILIVEDDPSLGPGFPNDLNIAGVGI